MFGFYSFPGRFRPVLFSCAAALAVFCATPAWSDTPGSNSPASATEGQPTRELPRIRLQINQRPVMAEVAIDAASHTRGLMFRDSLGRDNGMLFLFGEPQQPCFWMKNTRVPLSIAFIDAEGVIVSLADMQPNSLDAHCAIAPIQYALEMNQGWFARNAAGPGTPVSGLPQLRRPAPAR